MRITVTIILNTFFLMIFLSSVFGATILLPNEDQHVEAGSLITVIIKPDPGEQWQAFIIGFEKVLEYDSMNKVYKTTIQVPKEVLGYRDDLIVTGVHTDGRTTDFKRRIFVTLPSNVFLQSIMVGEDYMLLYKLPAGTTNPNDYERFFQSRQISASGLYSDGVKRKLTASTSGTTYSSSNEKVVTVSPDGKATAQGLGSAKITVENGELSAQVDIEVKLYRQPQ